MDEVVESRSLAHLTEFAPEQPLPAAPEQTPRADCDNPAVLIKEAGEVSSTGRPKPWPDDSLFQGPSIWLGRMLNWFWQLRQLSVSASKAMETSAGSSCLGKATIQIIGRLAASLRLESPRPAPSAAAFQRHTGFPRHTGQQATQALAAQSLGSGKSPDGRESRGGGKFGANVNSTLWPSLFQ